MTFLSVSFLLGAARFFDAPPALPTALRSRSSLISLKAGGNETCESNAAKKDQAFMTSRNAARLLLPVLLVAALVRPAAQAQDGSPEDQVSAAFAAYKAAILDSDGEAALQRVDSTTISYYAEMLAHARTLPEEQARALRPIDLLMMLAIRQRLSAEQVMQMDAEALFKRGVENGWVGSQGVAGLEIVEVEIDGKTATTSLESNGQPVPPVFRFARENGQWKIVLSSALDATDEGLRQISEQQGLSKAELVLLLLRRLADEPIDESTLWQPVAQR